MAARPIDAAEGYELFRRHGGRIELDEINEYLRGIGLREVSPRMYVHFQKLKRYGYESYISINRLDIAVAGEFAWSDDMRARYPEIAQPLDGEATWNAERYLVTVERLGAVSASVRSSVVPAGGTSLVLRLLATGIERTGRVIRTDPESGRFHISFDSYTSLPVAPADALDQAKMTFRLSDQAESVTAVADLLLRLDRFLIRSSSEPHELVRISRMQLNSPLEILLGGSVLVGAVKLLEMLIGMRKTWYEGTKSKYEAQSIALDNEAKRRNAQLEADKELLTAVEAEIDQDQTPLLDKLETKALPKGEPGDERRQRLIEAVRAGIELPIEVVSELTRQTDLADR
jgi:hypothetical protein